MNTASATPTSICHQRRPTSDVSRSHVHRYVHHHAGLTNNAGRSPTRCSSFTLSIECTHVASLAQSMVSAPMVRASPAAWPQNLWSCTSNSFECMHYDRQVRFGLPHPERGPLPSWDVLKPWSNSFILCLGRRVYQSSPSGRTALNESEPTREGRRTWDR
jgi:hypothetical protein